MTMTGKPKYHQIAILFVLLLSGCRESPKIESIIAHFDASEMPDRIEAALKKLQKDTLYTHYFDTLSVYYSERDFEPRWLNEFYDSAFLVSIKKLADSCVYDGFRRAHYQPDSVEYYLKKALKQKPPQIYSSLALADLYMSNFMLALWHDKVLGRSDPKKVLGMKYTLPYPNHPEFKLMDVLRPDSGLHLITNYRPAHPDYIRLRSMLYQAYAQTGGSQTHIDTNGVRKLKPGDSSNIIPALASRLVELELAPDSIIPMYREGIVYTKHLAGFVKQFQRTSNLSDDGVIGKSTLKILNASQNDRINEIRANMERLRWFGTAPPKPYVRVNIPEFILYMYYPDTLKKDSVNTLLVCVGQGKERYYDEKQKKYVVSKHYLDKPMNHETPQIYSNIDWVILNPTWTVPSSIVGREMYNHIIRDPGYLIRNNYQVLKDGKVINPYSIRWRQYKPGNIPYTIRQNAGDDNSLGKVKFTFRNPFDVYMHDTPLKNKFKLSNRAVSHGCVRVQTPEALTAFVLQQNSKVVADDVFEMMGLEPRDTARARLWREDTTSYKKVVKITHPVRVEHKMTVFFDYRTIVFNPDGSVRFIFDVYDKNRLIAEAMENNRYRMIEE